MLKDAFPWAAMWAPQLHELFAGYVAAKQEQNVLDYDDLLLYWAMMMREPAIAAELGARFDHVLVDEYQDTNRLQSAILLSLKPDGRGLTVVGDDAQSIYSFRAATVRNILEFPSSFAPPADIVTLDRNYRSTAPILDAANAVIAEAEERFTKNLWTERKSGAKPRLVTVTRRGDAGPLRRRAGARNARRRPRPQGPGGAVPHLAAFGPARDRADPPQHPVRQISAASNSSTPPTSRTCWRCCAGPRIRATASPASACCNCCPASAPASPASCSTPSTQAPRPFAALCRTRPPRPAPRAGRRSPKSCADLAALTRLAGRLQPRPALVRAGARGSARGCRRSACSICCSSSRSPRAIRSRERFLTELTLDPPEATSDQSGPGLKDEDYLILSTIHSAKGQEWKSVHVLNVVDGCIPSDLGTGSTHELEEERRLLYVAMTRARDELHMFIPQRFFVTQQAKHGDRHLYAQRTRFITRAMLPLYEDILWPPLKPLQLRCGHAEDAASTCARRCAACGRSEHQRWAERPSGLDRTELKGA